MTIRVERSAGARASKVSGKERTWADGSGHEVRSDRRWPALARHGDDVHAPTSPPETLFYDGRCGLCHGVVRFVLARDRSGAAFRFAPLQGESFSRVAGALGEAQRADSVFLRTHSGALLAKSDAVLHVLRRLGGGCGLLAGLLALFPRALRDLGYDVVARLRRRLFGTKDELCPVVPESQRDRFDP